MLVPGANVDAVGILLNHKLTRNIGKGRSPIVFKDERPIVVFSEQGVTPAQNDNALVFAGTGELRADGPNNISQGFLDEPRDQNIQENKPRKIGHVVIGLDISSSMGELSGANDLSTKLDHVKSAIKELIDNGIPKDTKVTLIVYNDIAQIAQGKEGTPFKKEVPVEYTSDLGLLFSTIQSLKPTGSTNFHSVLELACQKVVQYNPDKFKPETPLFIFITDGEQYGGPSESDVLLMAKNLRALNAHSLIIGTGVDYDERFLRTLTTELGPAMCVHTPHPNPSINVFGLFAPTFADDIRNPHYMSISARRFSPDKKFFDLLPTIKEASLRTPTKYRMYTGYQSRGIGIGFVPERDLGEASLRLRLQNHASGRVEHRVEIPIIPFDDAGAYHEYKSEAEDLLARLLAFLSQREWDADAFDSVVRDFPHSFDPSEAMSISQSLRSEQFRDDENSVRGAVADASMSVSVHTRGSYRSKGSDSLNYPPDESFRRTGEFPAEFSGRVDALHVPPADNLPVIDSLAPIQANAYNFNISLIHSGIGKINKTNISLGPSEEATIGRRQTCTIAVSDNVSVSRVHCKLIAESGKLYAADQGSRNGTLVNDIQVTKQELKNGDRIFIGGTNIIVNF